MKKDIKKNLYLLYALASSSCTLLGHEISLEEIFTTKQATNRYEVEALNRSCKSYNLALEFQQEEGSEELIATINVRGTNVQIPKGILESIYYTFAKEHLYKHDIAVVRPTDKTENLDFELSSEEIALLKKRKEFCRRNLEKLLNMQIADEAMPRIALCCSGGGYRAMISTMGLLAGLHETGLLDSIDYISALSGSTWALSSWMTSDENFNDFFGSFMERVNKGLAPDHPAELLEDIADYLPILAQECIRKLIFKETPSVIDIYGFCLGITLLDEAHKDDYLNTILASQLPAIEQGKKPFPLYTAIIPHDDENYEEGTYSWVEFSPYEVACYDLNGGVQSWGYGRAFEDGVSVTSAPPLSLGNLMGVWGSAIAVSFKELYDMVLSHLEPKILFAPLKLVAEEDTLGDIRLFAPSFKNFNYQRENSPYNQEATCHLIDAGIDCNLPFAPLLKEARAIDIIIVCDASSNVLGAPELRKAETHARKNGIPFPHVDYANITNDSFTIIDDGADSQAPIVVYIPMVENKTYHASFDPQKHLTPEGFLNTFNFVYSEHEALKLAGLLRFAAHEAKTSILETIKTVIARKS